MTAVEWLIDKLQAPCKCIPSHIIEQAKEMEKEQLIEAYCQGCKDISEDDAIFPRETSEKYYSETYGK